MMSYNLFRRFWMMLMLFSFGRILLAQSVDVRNIDLSEGTVNITYNLNDSIVGRYYTVRLYSSEDNFLNPLTEINGDIGMEVSPGHGRTLTWNAEDELRSSYKGKLSLELRARVYIPFINVDSFNDIKTLTRRRKENLTWSGGRSNNILNFNLYRGEEKVTTLSNIANVGHYELELPVHIKPGKGYYFLISDIKNKDEVVRTSEFRIKRKVPLLVKALPAFAIAGATTVLAPEGGGGSSEIPDPILPPEN